MSTVGFLDNDTGAIIYRTTRKALGRRVLRNALREQSLFRIGGKFWRVVRVVRWLALRVDVEEVPREDLLARPWCPDGIWSPPRRQPGE
jgi:hypothetical protein